MCFAQDRTGTAPSALDWDELDEALIAAFLEHLETDRGSSARTRNLRLSAIRSLFRYTAPRHPEHAASIARMLNIPAKRFARRTVTFLPAEESVALIAAAPPDRWEGWRDRAMLTLAIHTGLRVSELIGLNCGDIGLGTGAHVQIEGKGRKQRAVPLYVATAAQRCPSLVGKRVHPHVLRHSCAMSLLQARVDSTVIALWLGHADVSSTQQYIHADMTIKERALALLTPPAAAPGRYTPIDDILAYLDSLG